VAKINQKTFKRTTDYLAQKLEMPGLGFHTVVFNPADHELVRGEPKLRRSYLNQAISAHSLSYLESLKRYERCLCQRNALLKRLYRPENLPQSSFEEYTSQLISNGAQLVWERLNWMSGMQRKLDKILPEISDGITNLVFFYGSPWLFSGGKTLDFAGQFEVPSIENIKESFRDFLSQNRSDELYQQVTIAGPHRDDWGFKISGSPLKSQGSQGEVRSALLALKLSESELYQERTRTKPVFLLDDFSSELDEERREMLLGYMRKLNLQTFVTTTDLQFKSLHSYQLQNGKILSFQQELPLTV